MPKTYKLPSGKITKSVVRYCREWNKLSHTVAKALNCNVVGCDPTIHLIEKGAGVGFQISTEVATRIYNLYLNNENP